MSVYVTVVCVCVHVCVHTCVCVCLWHEWSHIRCVFFTRTSTFSDSRGKQLQFVVKKGTDDTFLWKATVRIRCYKVVWHHCLLATGTVTLWYRQTSVSLTRYRAFVHTCACTHACAHTHIHTHTESHTLLIFKLLSGMNLIFISVLTAVTCMWFKHKKVQKNAYLLWHGYTKPFCIWILF